MRLLFYKWFGFLDEHYWNAVTDLIDQAAGMTGQLGLLEVDSQCPFAFGTGKKVQQFWFDHTLGTWQLYSG